MDSKMIKQMIDERLYEIDDLVEDLLFLLNGFPLSKAQNKTLARTMLKLEEAELI